MTTRGLRSCRNGVLELARSDAGLGPLMVLVLTPTLARRPIFNSRFFGKAFVTALAAVALVWAF
jgi:hypothetical protein